MVFGVSGKSQRSKRESNRISYKKMNKNILTYSKLQFLPKTYDQCRLKKASK